MLGRAHPTLLVAAAVLSACGAASHGPSDGALAEGSPDAAPGPDGGVVRPLPVDGGSRPGAAEVCEVFCTRSAELGCPIVPDPASCPAGCSEGFGMLDRLAEETGCQVLRDELYACTLANPDGGSCSPDFAFPECDPTAERLFRCINDYCRVNPGTPACEGF